MLINSYYSFRRSLKFELAKKLQLLDPVRRDWPLLHSSTKLAIQLQFMNGTIESVVCSSMVFPA